MYFTLTGSALNLLRLLFPCLLALLLTGCEFLPVRDDAIVARPPRAQIVAFSFDGRFGIRQGETRHNANVEWRHRPDADEVLLTTPMGQGVAQLSRDSRGARLVKSDKEVIEAADWEGLSARLFGFALPLSDLPRWLLGDVKPTARDRAGRPQAALAAGWDLRYLDYESASPDALPLLIEFRRDDVELRLKVDAWRLE